MIAAQPPSPRISIVLPFRDAASTLGSCLDSIRRQSFTAFECLCLDDGSDDDGAAIVTAQAQLDPRIRLLHAPQRGIVAALNFGLRQARAPLVARMDADDLMRPKRLALQHAALTAEPDLTVLGSRVRAFPEASLTDGFRAYIEWLNACITEPAIAADIYLEAPLAHPSVMLRRDRVMAAGGYRDGPLPEDYDLWLRLHRQGHRLAKLPQTLLDWRDHPTRLSRRDPRYARLAFDRLRADYLAADPRLLEAKGRLVLWGAGRRTRQRAAHLIGQGYRPQAWIDIDPRKLGNRIDGVPVVPPEWLRDQRPRPLVLCYVASHGARPCIDAEFARLGYRRGVDYLHIG